MGAIIGPLLPAFLGRRRSWLLISQLILLISLYAISPVWIPLGQLERWLKIATFIALSLRHKILSSMLIVVKF